MKRPWHAPKARKPYRNTIKQPDRKRVGAAAYVQLFITRSLCAIILDTAASSSPEQLAEIRRYINIHSYLSKDAT